MSVMTITQRSARIERVWSTGIFAGKTVLTKQESLLEKRPSSEIIADNKLHGQTAASMKNADGSDLTVKKTAKLIKEIGLKAYLIAELYFIKTIILRLSARVEAATGCELGGRKRTNIALSAPLESVSTSSARVEVSSIIIKIASADAATGANTEAKLRASSETTANAEVVGGEALSNDTVEEVTLTAELAYWIYPELEDGVLTIRQAYSATQTNNVLEVV